MAARKTNIQIPGGLPLAVNIDSVTAKAVTVNTFCAENHAPARIKQTNACSECGNDVRSTHVRGVAVGKAPNQVVELLREEDAEAPTQKRDHGSCTLVAHPRTEVLGKTVTIGTMYALTPQAGNDVLYANTVALVEQNPQYAFLIEWGYSAKTHIWLMDVQMGVLVIRQCAHPNNVKMPTPPTAEPNALAGMMAQLVSEVPFTMDGYEDNDAAAKAALARIQGTPTSAPTEEVDLMAVLQAQIDAKAKPTKKKAA